MLGLDPSIPAREVCTEPVMPCLDIPLAREFCDYAQNGKKIRKRNVIKNDE
jgi:hypothetical protein